MTYFAIDQEGLKPEMKHRLNDAARKRLAQQVQTKQTNIQMHIRLTIAEIFITIGSRLAGHRQTEVVSQT